MKGNEFSEQLVHEIEVFYESTQLELSKKLKEYGITRGRLSCRIDSILPS